MKLLLLLSSGILLVLGISWIVCVRGAAGCGDLLGGQRLYAGGSSQQALAGFTVTGFVYIQPWRNGDDQRRPTESPTVRNLERPR